MTNQNVNKNEMKACRRGHPRNSKNCYYKSTAIECRRCAAMRKMRYRRDEGYRVPHGTGDNRL